MGKKRGQMKLSFGMIFSIILIIIFIAFAFFAIKKFLEMQGNVEAGQFINNLENDVNKMWRGEQGSDEFEYKVPSKVTHVCFVDFLSGKSGEYEEFYNELKFVYSGNENLFFYPIGSSEGLESTKIEHINIEEITKDDNPFCFEESNGKVKITIKKDFDDVLVMIE